LLATFGSIATLLKRDEVNNLWIPAEWVIVSVCAMGAVGPALLWIIDQLVYHRLLNALFILGSQARVRPARAAADTRIHVRVIWNEISTSQLSGEVDSIGLGGAIENS
jgi:hypothetical protein